jgi:hypothetical protein
MARALNNNNLLLIFLRPALNRCLLRLRCQFRRRRAGASP